jgi:aminoglycoside phosphotransferase family enzyme
VSLFLTLYCECSNSSPLFSGEIHMGDNGRNHADINLGNAVQAYTISAQQVGLFDCLERSP